MGDRLGVVSGVAQSFEESNVDPGRHEEALAQGHRVVRQGLAERKPGVFEEDASGEGVAVGVDSRRGQGDDDVASRGAGRVAFFVGSDGTDDESGQVVLAVRIHPRELGRLSAEEPTPRLTAALGDPLHHGRADRLFEPACGEVIQEEQRFRTNS